jgi:hypothetical protein
MGCFRTGHVTVYVIYLEYNKHMLWPNRKVRCGPDCVPVSLVIYIDAADSTVVSSSTEFLSNQYMECFPHLPMTAMNTIIQLHTWFMMAYDIILMLYDCDVTAYECHMPVYIRYLSFIYYVDFCHINDVLDLSLYRQIIAIFYLI